MKSHLSITLFLSILILFSCTSDNESGEETFSVTVYTKSAPQDGGEISSVEVDKLQSCVYLFEQTDKYINTADSPESVHQEGILIYTDGSTASPLYSSPLFQLHEEIAASFSYTRNMVYPPTSQTMHTFEDVLHNKYVLFVVVSYDGQLLSASSKSIVVNKKYGGTKEEKTFLYNGEEEQYGYQSWD